MKFNLGIADRAIRMLVGLGALYFCYTRGNHLLALLAVGLVITATLGFCPIYALFKFNSVGTHKDRSDKPPKDDLI